MAAYHQMGYHSSNLLDLPQISNYVGAVFSPLDCTQAQVAEQISEAHKSGREFETIFDPQLYAPRTGRGKLRGWGYFPKDVDTADLGSTTWWSNLNDKIAGTCQAIQAKAVCSPTTIPKVFDSKYYSLTVRVGTELAKVLGNHGVHVLQTVLVSLPELAQEGRALEVASVVSRTEAKRVYLVLVGSLEPRRELSEVDELKGAMRLINALEGSGLSVLVGFCSSELLLWKAAGASACASGKFFNLRRFTRQRFEEPKASGGGQLPYWFEEALLAFLREGDLIRVRKLDLFSEASAHNPFSQEILKIFDEASSAGTKRKAWLKIGWRQFLYWFADVEARLSHGKVTAENLLEAGDSNWSKVDAAKVLMEERHNNGTWVRSWLNALREYEKERLSA